MKKILFLIFLFSIYCLLFTISANAQTMSNSSYIIKMGNLNDASGDVSNSQYKLSETVGQTSPGLYSGTNYLVKAGFQYVRPTGNIAFSFAISQNIIDFGVITPTNPVTRTTNLTVSAGSAKGFTVVSSENKPLTGIGGTIPDTTCDLGTCNSSKASAWTSSLAYGFGYRCDNISGTNCASGFSDSFYKAFALTPSLQTVMTSNTGGTSRKSQLTYKVNVSGTQPPGIYTNIVTYIASPGF
ncbi:MAG TPA: hypothetical protein VKC89_00195 [Patescibacteria group bacterium]|nr:hypothetical protein [Patescibacteria group bacterium]